MRSGRPISLPIDPWPRASLCERMGIGVVLSFVLLLLICVIGAVCTVIAALTVHVYRSYDAGAALRARIDRRTGHARSG